MEYNVENLFDLRDDTLKNDEDFLPEGKYHWTPYRYWKKLNDVAQTIVAVGGQDGLPALVGLCEVENDTVLNDLVCRSSLRNGGYEYIMTDSPDLRGMDVALLFQPFVFQLLDWHQVRVLSLENGFNPTRNILYAKGILLSGDTLHVCVCHLPSKASGGQSATQHRKLATSTLRSVVDSVLSLSPQAKLLVMGDFNAASNEQIFDSLLPPLHETLPTSRKALRKAIGTYYFQKQWSYLDHILISDGFLDWQSKGEGIQQEVFEPKSEEQGKHKSKNARIVRSQEARLPFLLNEQGVPNRTFRGPVYNGGVSDHLPLYLEITIP